jgi:hypothetical protein
MISEGHEPSCPFLFLTNMTIITNFVKRDTFSSPAKPVMLYFAERAKKHKYRPFWAFSQRKLGFSEVSECLSMLP